ncbi:MAG: histidine kinase [Actinomycetota bacterium]|nr:histidine kinase [Actinomycetota bacterium]
MSGRTQRISFSISALAMVLVVVTAVLYLQDGVIGSDPVSNVLALLAVACYAVIGGLIVRRLPRNACGWLLLLIGFGLVATMCAEAIFDVALRDGHSAFASWALWVNSWLLVATAWPGIVLYLLVFPTGTPPSRRWRPLVIGVIALSLAGVLVRMVQPWSEERVANPVASMSVADALFAAIAFAFAAGVVISVVSVIRRFRRAPLDERRQLRWLAVVAVLAAAFLVIAIAAGVLGIDRIGDPFGVAFLLLLIIGLPMSAAIALLKHHLYGIEVVANRSIVYSSVAAVVTAIYAIVVGSVGAAAGHGDRPNVYGAVAATVVAAVVFQPVRRRAQRLADRLIYGDRASPYELVATFSERLDAASLQEVLPRMTALIAEGTGAQRVRIWLRNVTELRAVWVWPSNGESPSPMRLDGGELPSFDDPAFAVRHGGDLLGAITVGMPPQEPMTPATERLLVDLSAQAGLVLRNVALVEELQRSRQRLVTSQDEARRRLERDLHDGAQQRLVTLSMDLRMARARAGESGDVELTTRLDAADQELAQSLAELRELARGIHPAILTQNGVGAALRSLSERSAVPVELRSVPEGRFSPDVEATTYFIVSEALANVAKHAAASCAWVAVEDEGDRLAIEVRDDGVGGATMNGGSGLRGLADRVEAVGGRIDVRSEPGVGSTVHAEIPCASR